MRKKILIVDDEELNRELLRQIFEGTYTILTANNGKEAIEQFTKNKSELAAVLLDLVMPQVNGYQVLQALYAGGETETIPVILITANTDIKVALTCYSIGAADIVNKPFVAGIVRRRVMNLVELYASRERLQDQLLVSEKRLTESEKQLEEFNRHFMEIISEVVECRDVELGQHIKRMKGLTQIMATTYKRLYPECSLTPEKIAMLVQVAAVHDIGKIAIPDHILLKPGTLSDDERKVIMSHTTKGCDILTKLEDVQNAEQYTMAYDVVRYHHERYDGGGYPDRLRGEEIPLSAMLVSVADVYDALTSDRVYKKAYDREQAYRMIMEGECGVFAPKIIKCFEQARRAMELFIDSM